MHNKKMYMIGLVLVLVISFCFSSSIIAAPTRVGYINLERLVKESVMGKAAMEGIERLRQEKQGMISRKLKTINEIKIDLENNNELMKDFERKDRVDELNSLIKEYKRMVADAKEDITKEDQGMVAEILKEADGALKKVAKKKKFAIILKDPNAIGYLDESVDITEEVLKELNK